VRIHTFSRRCLCVLSLVVVALTAFVSTPFGVHPPASAQPVARPTALALTTIHRATSLTADESAEVSYSLVGASVFGAAPAPVTGAGAFDLRHGVGQATIRQPSGRQLIVLVPTVVFTRVPSGGVTSLPPGKSWMSASLTGSESLATNFPQFVVQVEGFNPLLYLDEASWGAVSAAPIGPRQVDGTRTTGYLVRVDLTTALARATGPSAASMSLAIKSELTSAGAGRSTTSQVSVRFWVDGAGRVVAIQGSPPGAGVGTTSITLSRFGVVIRPTPPRPSKVVDIASLTPSGERENNGGGDADGA
jgi:hypothetical protein